MKTTEKKHIIWTSDIDPEDFRESYEELYPDEELTDDMLYDFAYEDNDFQLECEKMNLNKELGQELVMFGTLGLWNGTRTGWKRIKGTNLNDIFQGTCGDYVTWYVDEDGDICCEDIHHDGTNHYKYRAIKSDISDWEFEELLAEGKPIDELTEKLGHYVADIYGW